MIDNIEYHITDKCNLNCKSCLHYCPLASNSENKSLGQIKFDLFTIARFEVHELHLFGGEPLLHDDLIEICKFTRKLFTNTLIIIITNGIIQLSDEQINILKELNIYVQISIYPFKHDWKEYYKQYRDRLNDIIINTPTKEEIDNIDNIDFQTKPLSNIKLFHNVDNMKNCRMRWCKQIVDGKLYICPANAYFNYFQNTFKYQSNINVTNINKIDYLDLTDYSLTEDDIQNFIQNSIPSLCYYCKECDRWANQNMEFCKWERSNKTIDEWI